MVRYLKFALAFIIFIYLSIVGYMYYAQKNFVYHPPKSKMPAIAAYDMGETQDIYLTTQDNVKLHAWYHKPQNPCDKIVLFLHGNTGFIDARKDKVNQLREMGYGFLLPAWRGYGNSEGSPSKAGLYEDARTAIKFLQDEGYDLATQVILIGESLGTGVATYMAQHHQFRGLMLLAPYTKIKDLAQEKYPFLPVKHLLEEDFQTVDNLAAVRNTPVLVVHGRKDQVIPCQHSERVVEAVTGEKKLLLYEGVYHVDFDNIKIFAEMEQFFGLNCKHLKQRQDKEEAFAAN